MTVEQAARDFFGWFNRHYPAPSTNPDHEWNRLGVALANHQEEAQRDTLLLRQALEALEFEAGGWECPPPKTTAAITALRERLGKGDRERTECELLEHIRREREEYES